jgi:hypothetical protein
MSANPCDIRCNMVSKLTGLPRGRPRKIGPQAPPPGPAHRPRQLLYSDPDRFALAHIVALMDQGRSAKWASGCAAFGQRGEIVDMALVADLGLTPDQLAKMLPRRRNQVAVEVRIRKGSTTSVRNHARALAMKLERYQKDPAARCWLQQMAEALHAALASGDPAIRAERLKMIPALDIALTPAA